MEPRRFGKDPDFDIAGGYALTHNVPKDFWEKWLRDNKDSDIVRKKLIFAHAEKKSAKAFCREHEKLLSGFEPIDPENPMKKLPGGRLGVNQNSATRQMKVETAEVDE